MVADIEGKSFVAECKGGVINSRHAGRLSRIMAMATGRAMMKLPAQRSTAVSNRRGPNRAPGTLSDGDARHYDL